MPDKYTALSGSPSTILSTELNSVTNNSLSSLGSTVDNDGAGQRHPLCMVEVYLAAQGANRSAGAAVDVLLIPTIDATNFGDTNGDCADNYVACTVSIDSGASAARRIVVHGVELPPSDFKPALRNRTGQTLAASGSTVKIEKYTREDV